VLGIGRHSETHEDMVIYQPLYDASSTRLGDAQYAVRPLSMWEGEVEREGEMVKRFAVIE
jgi:hypothetical protein